MLRFSPELTGKLSGDVTPHSLGQRWPLRPATQAGAGSQGRGWND